MCVWGGGDGESEGVTRLYGDCGEKLTFYESTLAPLIDGDPATAAWDETDS